MSVPPPKLLNSFQNTSSPDINLERDLVIIGEESEALLGMGVGELEIDENTKFRFNIATIMISAFIFLAILAWFDFMQTAFYVWLSPEVTDQLVAPSVKLWYAILITFMVIILVYLIHYYTRRTI